MTKSSITALLFIGTLSGCVGHDMRPMPYSERTVVSDGVAQLVNNSEDGQIDIRDHENVRCERIRIVGTHIHTRHCYTLAEKVAADAANQDAMRDEWGKIRCLDPHVGGACNNR